MWRQWRLGYARTLHCAGCLPACRAVPQWFTRVRSVLFCFFWLCVLWNVQGHPRCFTASDDGHAYVWDLAAEKVVASFAHPCASAGAVRPAVHDVAFMHTHEAVATASQDGRVRVWGTSCGMLSRRLGFVSIHGSAPTPPHPACMQTGSRVCWAPDIRSGKCTREFIPAQVKGQTASGACWLGSVAVDATESWLVRVFRLNGSPFFCAADVLRCAVAGSFRLSWCVYRNV